MILGTVRMAGRWIWSCVWITIEGRKYTTWFGTVERAEEIAGRLLSSGPSDDLKTLLKEAVLTGYDLQKDDFDED